MNVAFGGLAPHLRVPLEVPVDPEEHPQPEEDVHRELCLHHEEARGGHQPGHQVQGHLAQGVRALRKVAQQVVVKPG